jgi:chitinase
MARTLCGAVLAVLILVVPTAASAAVPQSRYVNGRRSACDTPVAPYMYAGWGRPQNPATVIRNTGVRCFTIAFVLDRRHCTPGWETRRSTTALTRGKDAALVRGIRAAGGDVIPSTGGGYDRTSLENRCSSARALAHAYGTIVRTLGVHALDIDLEGDAEASAAVRAKVLRAIGLLHHRHPNVRVIFTVPVNLHGLHAATIALVRAAAATHRRVAVWSIMPFDSGGPRTDMVRHAISSASKLHALLHRLYPYASSAALYAREGLTPMAGRSDAHELTTVADFEQLATYTVRHGLGRLSFWAVGRDRPCPHRRSAAPNCSGTAAPALAFTRALAAAQ